ncbi:MAG TPA: alpha-L-arabinofuranosidase C-terminal domain-containing protein [Tepidisphaeraceae bacterium]|nr:alpha-L-arabinofuranosidase C-terminal domain-containing protein [Tepidisphaeraceae bacterium]
MRKRMEILGLPVVLLAVSVLSAPAFASGSLTVDVSKPGVAISPTLYGLMTEEINHSYDGGLYAELIRNRIFQDSDQTPVHWSAIGGATVALDTSDPINQTALTRSLRLDAAKASADQRAGVANDGYWGIPVFANTKYTASFYAKGGGGLTGPLTVDIESNDGATIYATATIPSITTQWRRYSVDLTTTVATPSATNRLVISTQSPGQLWLNLVSLMPPTYHDRPNGNRIDLMQKLADMHPAFLRFPGGNYLEGDTIAERFDWKKTIGPLEDRPGHRGPWGYRSSDGLGLLEFLEWCEDLHMEPILAVYAGYSLHGEKVIDAAGIAPFVQDALDEIEYVTGDASTKWGRQRAADGHPDPFHLTYVEIGNEDNLDHSGSYNVRFPPFFDAIKAKYPQLKIIATGPLHTRTPDLYDDHYYRSSRAMERDVHHYDGYNRNGPKIFVGEWATTEGRPTPNLQAALADAAWLTGLERNSDVVLISCYAPLLVNVNPGAAQWGTNLIGYDALSSFGSPSYYAQKMFSENRGDHVLPVDVAIAPGNTPPPPPSGAVGVGTWNTSAEFKDIQVTGPDGQTLYQTDFSNGDTDWRFGRGFWTVVDGALRQGQNRTDCRATVGDVKWTDYTYTLKARKISGLEGFLIVLHYRNANDQVRWSVGGWGNTGTSLERVTDGIANKFGPTTPMYIQDGRWYDIRIEVKGADIKCYLDGQLISEGTEPPATPMPPIFAEASRDDSNGQVILKVVNVSATPQSLQIRLNGAGAVSPNATAEVLTGEPGDQNSIEAPLKVAPQSADITDAAPQFTHEFPAYSVSVMRLDVQ